MFDALDRLLARKSELEEAMARPEALGDQDRMRELGREHSQVSEMTAVGEELRKLTAELSEAESIIAESGEPEFVELAEAEAEQLRPRVEKLEREFHELLNPADPRDSKNIILEIRAGTGGEEAALFAAELFRMYSRYAEDKGWKVELISGSPTGIGGFKEIVANVSGRNVFKRMKFESGAHRVQRVPETESAGRIHTSAVTVAMLAEADKVDIAIKSDDLRIDTYRASSAGGQHVNKTDSAVRITHEPSGIVVTSQDQRSQHQNREKAMMLLRAHLLDAKVRAQKEEIDLARKAQVGSGDRSQRIRTYNYPQGRVTDHRIGLTLYRLEYILQGDMDELIDALIEDESRKSAEAAGRA